MLIYGGVGGEPQAAGTTSGQMASMEDKVAQLQVRMAGRIREEMMKQMAVQTSISLGLLAVPVIGWIMSAIYTVISLPGSLYAKQRMANLIRGTQHRIAAAADRVQDEITVVQRRIQDEVFDEAVILAVSGEPIPGFSGLGGMFSKATKAVTSAVKKTVSGAASGASTLVKSTPKVFAVKRLASAPVSVAKYVNTVAASVAAIPQAFSFKNLMTPEKILKAVGKVGQTITDPVFQPLEHPVGLVWRPVTQAAMAIPAAFVWAGGQIIIRTASGVMLAMGDNEGAARMDDSARKWDKFSRDRVWLRSAETLQTADNAARDVRKAGQYIIGTAGLDELKDKLAQMEAAAYKLLAAKRLDALATLATPEARAHILLAMADAMRQSPEGLAAMDAHARYLRAMIYNKNNLMHPDQVTPEPSFGEAVAEGWSIVTGRGDPLATYGDTIEAQAVAGLGSDDRLGGMTVSSLMTDRTALQAQLQALVEARAKAYAALDAMPSGEAYSIAVAQHEATQPQYERSKQRLEAQITAANDQIAATQRDSAQSFASVLMSAGGTIKDLASAAITRGASEYGAADARLKQVAAQADMRAAAAEQIKAGMARSQAAKASKVPLVLGVAVATLALLYLTRKN